MPKEHLPQETEHKLLEVRNLSIRIVKNLRGKNVESINSDSPDNSNDSDYIVNSVNFALHRNKITALVGESGSGKSLSANSILRLLPKNMATEGEIIYHQENLQENSQENCLKSLKQSPQQHSWQRGSQRNLPSSAVDCSNLLKATEAEMQKIRGNEIGMIFQEPLSALNPLHTIGKQMAEAILLHQPFIKDLEAKIDELFTMVGLENLSHRKKSYPHQISGGQRQRLMLAMAISNNPNILIADEPTTALDKIWEGEIMKLLKDLQSKTNMAILLITHDLSLVKHYADNIFIMQKGQVIEQGTTREVFHQPRHEYTKMLLDSAPKFLPKPIDTSAKNLLAAQNLSIKFPVKKNIFGKVTKYFNACCGASFNLKQGETIGIIGESGSGKTSIAYAILRLIKSCGAINFLEHDFQNLPSLKPPIRKFLRRNMQAVFQDPFSSLNPRMNIEQIITEGFLNFNKSAGKQEARKQAIATLQQVGIIKDGGIIKDDGIMSGEEITYERGTHQSDIPEASSSIKASMNMEDYHNNILHKYPHQFSGGQRQRIALCRSLILSPKLIILDEPTSALDVKNQKQVLELLAEIQQKTKISYILISHDINVIRCLSHQILVLKDGVVTEQGASAELLNNPQSEYGKKLLNVN